MSDLEPFQLHTTPRTGETLRGELVLQAGTPGLERVSRVVIRVQGMLEYYDEGTRREVLSGSELVRDRPLRGELRIPFDLGLPRDAPPSYQGKDVRISWELVASLHEEGGGELMRWSRPLQLEPGRTTRTPEWITPRAPRGSSAVAASTWGCLLFPLLFCICPGVFALFGDLLGSGTKYSAGERAVGIIFCLVLIAAGVGFGFLLFGKARTVSKFKAASFIPLAESFPLGATARLRVFLELTTTFTVRGARIELSAYEGVAKKRSMGPVPVQLPARLTRGWHQFDVELPIPRDIPPTFSTHLGALCTLTLQFEGYEDMQLHASIKLAPEVLEEVV
ncbi:hypothetical protein [Archangium lipolyticum]|uniref:hypothetical protein n=1 Tax=Archangium lipolyticum TaxID=2970465 RepID=UPI002149CEC5|nr:hypothetical protein [Archangium lipolyticum]